MNANELITGSMQLKDFIPLMETLTGLKLSFYNFTATSKRAGKLAVGEEYLLHSCGYCLAAKSKDASRRACYSSDGRTATPAILERRIAQHTCHAGVSEILQPVFSGKNYLGCVVAGQAFFKKYSSAEKDAYIKYLKTLGVDVEKASVEFDKMRVVGPESVRLAAKLVKIVAGFIAEAVQEEEKKTLLVQPAPGRKNSAEAKRRAAEGLERIRAGRYAAIIERVKENMAASPSGSISLKEAAGIAGISPCHFSRIYKEATGKKFRDFTTEERIVRAKMILADNSAKLSDVAVMCGYEEASSFSRAFKKLTGKYPGQYRLEKALKTKSSKRL